MVKFTKEDFKSWSDFRSEPKNTLQPNEFELNMPVTRKILQS